MRRRSVRIGGHRLWLAAIVVAALAFRIGAIVAEPHPYELAGLSAPSGEMARNLLAHGRWFEVDSRAWAAVRRVQAERQQLVDPAEFNYASFNRNPRYRPYTIELPGPALLLAGLWGLTGDQRYIYLQVLQALIDAALVLLVFWITRELFRRTRPALIAATLYALFPPYWFIMRIPVYDAWAVFIPPVVLACVLKARKSERSWPWLLAAGIATGVGLYFRFMLILVPLAIGLALLVARVGWRRAVSFGAIPLVVGLAILAPLTIHNYAVFDRFIPANTGFGQVLWQGLGNLSNDFGAVNSDAKTLAMVNRKRPTLAYATPEYDDYLRHKAFNAIRSEPLFYAKLVAYRAVSSTAVIRRQSLLAKATLDYGQPLWFLLSIVTVVLLWRTFKQELLLLIAVLAGVLAVPLFIAGFDWRYVLPGSFVYFVLSGLAIDAGLTRWGARRSGDASPARKGPTPAT